LYPIVLSDVNNTFTVAICGDRGEIIEQITKYAPNSETACKRAMEQYNKGIN